MVILSIAAAAADVLWVETLVSVWLFRPVFFHSFDRYRGFAGGGRSWWGVFGDPVHPRRWGWRAGASGGCGTGCGGRWLEYVDGGGGGGRGGAAGPNGGSLVIPAEVAAKGPAGRRHRMDNLPGG